MWAVPVRLLPAHLGVPLRVRPQMRRPLRHLQQKVLTLIRLRQWLLPLGGVQKSLRRQPPNERSVLPR